MSLSPCLRKLATAVAMNMFPKWIQWGVLERIWSLSWADFNRHNWREQARQIWWVTINIFVSYSFVSLQPTIVNINIMGPFWGSLPLLLLWTCVLYIYNEGSWSAFGHYWRQISTDTIGESRQDRFDGLPGIFLSHTALYHFILQLLMSLSPCLRELVTTVALNMSPNMYNERSWSAFGRYHGQISTGRSGENRQDRFDGSPKIFSSHTAENQIVFGKILCRNWGRN